MNFTQADPEETCADLFHKFASRIFVPSVLNHGRHLSFYSSRFSTTVRVPLLIYSDLIIGCVWITQLEAEHLKLEGGVLDGEGSGGFALALAIRWSYVVRIQSDWPLCDVPVLRDACIVPRAL